MKKTLVLIGFSIAFLLSINAYTGKVYEPKAGQKAPELRIEPGTSREMKLSDMRGEYVLLNFWSSTDAASRISARDYEKAVSDIEEGKLRLLSMNFDRSENVFNEIVKIDNLSKEIQHYVSGREADEISRTYDLSDGFKSFLIDREGRIIAVNPSVNALKEISRN